MPSFLKKLVNLTKKLKKIKKNFKKGIDKMQLSNYNVCAF